MKFLDLGQIPKLFCSQTPAKSIRISSPNLLKTVKHTL
jgi:hypothetical protein